MSCKPNTEGEKQGRAANGYAQQISSLPVSTHEYQFTYWCPRHFYWCLRLPRDVAAIAKQQQYISSEIIMSTPTWVGWTNPEYDWTDRQLGSSAQIGLKITFLKPPTSESEKSLRTYKHLPRHSKYPLKNETNGFLLQNLVLLPKFDLWYKSSHPSWSICSNSSRWRTTSPHRHFWPWPQCRERDMDAFGHLVVWKMESGSGKCTLEDSHLSAPYVFRFLFSATTIFSWQCHPVKKKCWSNNSIIIALVRWTSGFCGVSGLVCWEDFKATKCKQVPKSWPFLF